MGGLWSHSSIPDIVIKCGCGNRATYRCESTVPTEFGFCRTLRDISKISNSVQIDDAKKRALLVLVPYWKSTSMGATDTRVRWVACEQCITAECRSYFSHHPSGWKEFSPNCIGLDVMYETIQSPIRDD